MLQNVQGDQKVTDSGFKIQIITQWANIFNDYHDFAVYFSDLINSINRS